MSTTTVVATLYQLQQLDLELERLAAEQQATTSALQGNPALQKLRAEHKTAEQQLRSVLKAQQEVERTLEDLNNRLNMQEKRLYSGTVINPKELTALQQEIHRLRAQQDHQEEVVLEMMDNSESLQEAVHSKAQTLREAEEKWARDNAAMLLRRDELEMRRQELLTKRAAMTSTIDPTLLNRYDTMRRSKQGRAVSKVEQNSCQWCRVILTPSELQRVRISTELQMCSNCGRILYYDR